MSLQPYTDVRAAMQAVDAFSGAASEFVLPIAESLLDPIGMNIALITDRILAKGWEPNGIEQKQGYRLFRYKEWSDAE